MKRAELAAYLHNLSAGGFARYAIRRAINDLRLAATPYTLRSRHTRFPLWCRPRTSDLSMFAEILCHRAFRCLDGVADARLIVDCGANVGYSSAYFLSRYADATVIAIEPDAANFELLERNVAPYGGRCRLLRTAVWSHPTGMVLAAERLGAGNECARTVRPIIAGERPEFVAIDIGSLLDASGFDRISILKVDIEGAERIVFASNYAHWLPRVDSLIIELHDEECSRVFQSAIAGEDFVVSSCDEQTVCLRKATRPSAVDGERPPPATEALALG